MKKIISLISLFIIVLVLSGCSNTRINDPIEKAIDFSDLQLAYDEMHYENEVIQTIHDEYNQYFFGIYMDNGVIGVSIKNDIPSSGLDLLDESDIPYKFVKYNYTELINIYYLVVEIGRASCRERV